MKTFEVLIIGSGFGGQCAAINLLKAGIDDFRLLERRDFFGGTWCQNTYPGATVDIPSPLYSLSFAPFPWTQMYAGQEELQRYTRHVVERFGLMDRIETGAEVQGLTWDDATRHWTVQTSKGTFSSRFVINASGPLSQPQIPSFEGMDVFKGTSFHSNHWDLGFDHRGKRVAIVGSGASAAQIIPAIASDVSQLHVFQRTAHWVLPRPDHTFSQLQRRLLTSPLALRLLRALIYLKLETRFIGFKYSKAGLALVQWMARRHLKRQVPNAELRRKLTPDFTLGCKRVLLSSELYPALQRSNVTLHSASIARLDQNGIVTTDGEHLALDLIVWATGFETTDNAIPYPIEGRDGQRLAEVWQPFPRAYLGTCVPGFPNLFLITGPNTSTGHTSALFMLEAQMHYVMASIASVRNSAQGSIEVRPEAEERYTAMIHREMKRTVWFWGGCRSWYQSNSGKVTVIFPGFSFSFYRLTRWLKPGDHVLRE
ncbi:NAD(P)/FAD-dependent oxidoreductase [Pseudomonas putida]|uniref:flavin-containing monooxygenase n=1 Tax=Pseudomonas putida TaxID=303 RepID=UPI0023633981|nr:NAD(P)/FAD-dependent oxidoreductase [Pseudomonas putida]MDD1965619.1 NAD(P)/FAD-dependent oxidoreductase [Pseudomonas putida]